MSAAKYGVKTIVQDMICRPNTWKAGKEEEGVKSWSSNAEIMTDVQKELFRALGDESAKTRSYDAVGCYFHECKDGVKCNPKKRRR